MGDAAQTAKSPPNRHPQDAKMKSQSDVSCHYSDMSDIPSRRVLIVLGHASVTRYSPQQSRDITWYNAWGRCCYSPLLLSRHPSPTPTHTTESGRPATTHSSRSRNCRSPQHIEPLPSFAHRTTLVFYSLEGGTPISWPSHQSCASVHELAYTGIVVIAPPTLQPEHLASAAAKPSYPPLNPSW